MKCLDLLILWRLCTRSTLSPPVGQIDFFICFFHWYLSLKCFILETSFSKSHSIFLQARFLSPLKLCHSSWPKFSFWELSISMLPLLVMPNFSLRFVWVQYILGYLTLLHHLCPKNLCLSGPGKAEGTGLPERYQLTVFLCWWQCLFSSVTSFLLRVSTNLPYLEYKCPFGHSVFVNYLV